MLLPHAEGACAMAFISDALLGSQVGTSPWDHKVDKAGRVPAPFFPLRAVWPTIHLHLSSTPFIAGSRLLKQDSSGTGLPLEVGRT